ncbi:MAG: acyltransferase [Bacilli bacterium]|nr:acyltransferase [Bacilli bacterium]
MSSKYYKGLDVMRVLSCIAVLLYHIGLLKGGYLAVCIFFVLSGYLSVMSGFKKDEFSFKKYYLSRLKKVYLPLFIVVFITVFCFANSDWINLKQETTSIIFGYNNYWQLNANLDYFVKLAASPFTHLWYISILIQFEIVFPILFFGLRGLGQKISKVTPCIFLIILSIMSYLLFKSNVSSDNLMVAYYDTFCRLFSVSLGILLGFIHVYYGSFVLKNKNIRDILFWIYISIVLIMCLFVDSKSKLLCQSMLATSLISMRLIGYGRVFNHKNDKFDRIISMISKLSYEIYLVQYPVIFFFQSINISSLIKIPLIIIITFIISYILNFALKYRKNRIVKIVILIPIILLSLFGLYKYISSKDYAKEMKKLEEDLNKNRKVIVERQKKYKAQEEKEKSEWENMLNDINNSEKEIESVVKNLKIVGVGDSIMELTVNNLYDQFPNGYFDAKVNRTEKQSIDVISDLKKKGILGDIVLLNVGTNGNCPVSCKENLIEAIGDRRIFWVNATNPDYDTFNPILKEVAEKHDNIHIIDWISVANAHPEYLIKDKVHPSVTGCKVFAETIYNAIYREYLEEINSKKIEKIKKYEEKEKNKITFIGNDLLLEIYDQLSKKYSDSEIIIDKDFTYKTLVKKIKSKINDKSLSSNVVLLFNKQAKLTEKEYKKIIEMLKGYNLYVTLMDRSIFLDDVNMINFYSELKKNKDYLKIDGVHLTDNGIESLVKLIDSTLK